IAENLLDGVKITKILVEEIKEKIRSQESEVYSNPQADDSGELNKNLRSNRGENWQRKRDMFASWQRDWSVFHTFFFRDETKENVQRYLDQIGQQLLRDLEISDYQI